MSRNLVVAPKDGDAAQTILKPLVKLEDLGDVQRVPAYLDLRPTLLAERSALV